ncbi:Transposon Ty3-G Gag-Pol polyprotein [Labeo rohita]|uniref:Transposon Ty3-G Gag-Pol polyprotein n=1 Tax=Labeo rohita TaxID=84645 RepID=A0ABQ8L2J2_LABRO|nr:Transposon Ty3-G Gag-Pol polyprotein [Labeo rohita]
MDPAVLVLLLEQGDRSLEDHTTDFVFLTNYTHYPDNCLCSFYFAGLTTTTRAQLSGDGPRESLAVYVEWVLVSCNSSLTADFTDNDTSPTLDPEPSQPRFAEHEPEPTVDGEPEPSVTDEPSPSGATELQIAQEPEPILSDQVRELATSQAMVGVTVEHKRAMESPTHCTATAGELRLDLGLLDLEQDLIDFYGDVYEDMPTLLPPSSELPDCLDFPPTLPLLSPSIVPAASVPPPLSAGSPSAHPQPTICVVGSLQVCQSPSVSWLEDPSSPPPASESRTPPRPSDPGLHLGLQLPCFHRRPSAHQLHRASSSLRLALDFSGCTSSLRPTGSIGLLPPSSSASVLCHSGFTADLRISTSTSVTRALGSALALRTLSVAQDHRLSASGSTSVSAHLGLAWLLLLQVPSVFSLTPPSIVTTLDFVCCPPPGSPSTARASSYSDFFAIPRPLLFVFVFFYSAGARLPGGGSYVTPLWTVYVGFSLLHSVLCLSSGLVYVNVNVNVYATQPVDLPVWKLSGDYNKDFILNRHLRLPIPSYAPPLFVTLNPAICVDHYLLPRIEDLFASLAGGQLFSKLDLSNAYLQRPHQPILPRLPFPVTRTEKMDTVDVFYANQVATLPASNAEIKNPTGSS